MLDWSLKGHNEECLLELILFSQRLIMIYYDLYRCIFLFVFSVFVDQKEEWKEKHSQFNYYMLDMQNSIILFLLNKQKYL